MPDRGRAWRAALATLIWLVPAEAVLARCAGRDLLEVHRSEDPAGIAAMFERAHAAPNAQGRLWEVRIGGTAPSLLFGTFHSGAAIASAPEMVWTFAETADVAIFEMDGAERAAFRHRMATDPNFAFDSEAPPLADRVPPDARADLDAALRARGLSLDAAAQMRPWLVVSLLGFPVCHLRAASTGERPLDVALAEHAAAAGVDVIGLESHEESIAAFGRIDPRVLHAEIALAAATADETEDIFRTHRALYETGEVQAMREFSLWLAERLRPGRDHRGGGDAMMAEILDRRNRAWMPVLMDRLGKGGALVAVGALHLPGEAGLIELLRARGARVVRLD